MAKTNTETSDFLKQYIPKSQEDGFLKRKVQEQVTSIFKNTQKPVFLVGDAGVGKTAMIRNIAYDLKLPFMLIQVDASLNFNDLLYKVRLENATTHYEPGLLIKFIQNPSVILFDELPSANAEIFFKLHELLQERRIYVKELDQIFEVHKDCRIAAAGNFKNSLYVGNNKLNAALTSRFVVKVLDDFTVEELSHIISYEENKEMKEKIIQFYQKVKEVIVQQKKRYVITIRHLQSIVQLLKCGFQVKEAFKFGFIDSIAVNNNLDEMRAIDDIAMTSIPGYVSEEA